MEKAPTGACVRTEYHLDLGLPSRSGGVYESPRETETLERIQ